MTHAQRTACQPGVAPCSRPLLRAVILCCGLVAAAAVWALPSDRDQPIDIYADFTEFAEDQGVTVMRGNFRLEQGTLLITADQATLYQTGREVVRVHLQGGPVTLRQQLEDGSWSEAEAQEIDYLRDRDLALLNGNAVVRQTRGTLRANQMRYDVSSGRLEGTGEQERVHMRIEARPRPQGQ